MTKKRLRKLRAARIRQQIRAERETKPEPYRRADAYRFGVLSKR